MSLNESVCRLFAQMRRVLFGICVLRDKRVTDPDTQMPRAWPHNHCIKSLQLPGKLSAFCNYIK